MQAFRLYSYVVYELPPHNSSIAVGANRDYANRYARLLFDKAHVVHQLFGQVGLGAG